MCIIYFIIGPKYKGTKMGRPLNDAYFPPNRRLAQLDLWGCYKRSIMGSHVPLEASLPCKETVVSSILIGSTKQVKLFSIFYHSNGVLSI